MAIKYKLLARKNPLDQAAAPKYYAKAISNGKRDLMTLAKRISANTTMGIGDIHGVLLTLEQEIGYALQDGITVELGDICFFAPSVQSEGVSNASDFNAAAHIKKKGVNVRAKKAFVKKMSDVPVEREL
jgi:predicted histone-like DNA-binding protein